LKERDLCQIKKLMVELNLNKFPSSSIPKQAKAREKINIFTVGFGGESERIRQQTLCRGNDLIFVL
jgi:hypothetical protein